MWSLFLEDINSAKNQGSISEEEGENGHGDR